MWNSQKMKRVKNLIINYINYESLSSICIVYIALFWNFGISNCFWYCTVIVEMT